jgi:hypothetical protein
MEVSSRYLAARAGSDLLARRQVETPDWLRQDHGGSLFAGWPPSADGAFPMPAGLEQFRRVWKEQFPGNWTNGCSLSERLRCQGELNVFHLLLIGAIGRFTDRTSDKR